MTVHSTARILLWCGWAYGVESVNPPTLIMLAVVSATAFVFEPYRRAAWRLLYRSRWLMLVLLLTYAYTLPGKPIWPEWGGWSPTQQGLTAGGVRALRLGLMLIGLAMLLVSTPRLRLIYGLYVLLRPFQCLGFNRRAFAVRLGLTLEYIDRHAPGGSLQQWLAKLKQPIDQDIEPTVYRLPTERWRWHDSLLLAGAWSVVLVTVI